VPMLLQLVAIIWKEHKIPPQNRTKLYRVALEYLLEYRDLTRDILPLFDANQARRILCPASLWMQTNKRDEANKDGLHKKMQPEINTINEKFTAKEFCENLRDRAGLIADCGKSAYIFRHKSFREYLAALALVEHTKRNRKCLRPLVKHLGDDWWEEPLRFYISEVDADLFNDFMDALFASDVSKRLDQKQQNLLRTMVCEATQVKVDSLVKHLNDGRLSDTKKRYILDCLKVIDKADARLAVSEFAAKEGLASEAGVRALEIQLETGLMEREREAAKVDSYDTQAPSFRNRYEYNAEYILIPGGRYNYQGEVEKDVSNVYFAKYPVTNKRYRRYIRYLEGKEGELLEILPRERFDKRMIESSSPGKDFGKHLSRDVEGWVDKLRSAQDTEKRFNGDDQPVVGVSWFAARAYCLWLSALEQAGRETKSDGDGLLYRLPTEIEWEWAAGGGERRYPWGDKRPDVKLANYARNEGATTPVGRYPDGATPRGLMDMAGNVWEWMDNWYDEDTKRARCLRGGSWLHYEYALRCSYRADAPDDRPVSVGFRVVRSQS
jgi:formylglycine-generating enzyme required for sulfatase activity